MATQNRGLMCFNTTPDAIIHLLDEKNVNMLTSHKVFSLSEIRSRYEITMENYCKTVLIEANTMSQMTKREILPAVEEYIAFVANSAASKKTLDSLLPCTYEVETVKQLSVLSGQIYERCSELDSIITKVSKKEDLREKAFLIKDELLSKMSELRVSCDVAEVITAEKFWPFPTYGELLFGIR